MKMTFSIDRLEGDKAILKDIDDNTIIWPRMKLPEGSSEGQSLNFEINSDGKKGEKDQEEAKDILNEILDIND